jgi:hypothetical protein
LKKIVNDALAQAPKALADTFEPAHLGAVRVIDSALVRELNLPGGWFFSDQSCSSTLLNKGGSLVPVTIGKASRAYRTRLGRDELQATLTREAASQPRKVDSAGNKAQEQVRQVSPAVDAGNNGIGDIA